jgi:hypothetical protein
VQENKAPTAEIKNNGPVKATVKPVMAAPSNKVTPPSKSLKQIVQKTVEKAVPLNKNEKKVKLSVIKNDTKLALAPKIETTQKASVNPNAIPSHDDPRFEDV